MLGVIYTCNYYHTTVEFHNIPEMCSINICIVDWYRFNTAPIHHNDKISHVPCLLSEYLDYANEHKVIENTKMT